MNNNFEKVNEFSHDTINLINKFGHEILECAVNNSIPIINNISSSNLKKNDSNTIYPEYYMKNYEDSIYILIELCGIEKEKCKINIQNNTLKISAKTNLLSNDDNNWNFIKNKTYYRNIQLPCIVNNENITANMKNGILKIIIKKHHENFESNININ